MAKRKTAAKTAKKSAKTTARRAAKRPAAKKAARRAAPAAPTLRTVTPYLAVNGAADAIEWYKKAFGAKEVSRQPAGDKLMHAELKIGDSSVFLSDIFPGSDAVDPAKAGPSVNLHLWHKDADKLWQRAVAAGAKVTMPMDDMFWGDRYGKLIDPYGHSWALSYRSKLSKAQLDAKREAAMKDFASMGAGEMPQ